MQATKKGGAESIFNLKGGRGLYNSLVINSLSGRVYPRRVITIRRFKSSLLGSYEWLLVTVFTGLFSPPSSSFPKDGDLLQHWKG